MPYSSLQKLNYAKAFNNAVFRIIESLVPFMNQDRREELFLVKAGLNMAVKRFDVEVLVDRITRYNFILPYSEKIVEKDIGFFMTVDYVAHLAQMSALTQEERIKATKWIDFINVLKALWPQLPPKAQKAIWVDIDAMHEAYLTYLVTE